MRRLAFRVPGRVLTSHARDHLAQLTSEIGGLWLSAADAAARPDIWPARVPEDEALISAIRPSEGAALGAEAWGRSFPKGPRGRRLLALRQGQNGGYADAEAWRPAACWSAALVFRAGGPAKTLLALRSDNRADNYLFLSEDEPGRLLYRDNSDKVRIEADLGAEGAWQVVVLSTSQGRMALRLPGHPIYSASGLIDLPEKARLLVGCRAAREGMPKSLGKGGLAELFFWPGIDCLQGEAAPQAGEPVPPAALLSAFDAFCLWEL